MDDIPEVVKSEDSSQSVYKHPVLLAEDNAVARFAIKHLLEMNGYAVTVTADGKAALEALKKQTFAWVLLDVGLPKLKGTEVCKHYRQWEKEMNKPHLAIFALSSHTMDEMKLQFKTDGIDKLFTKPLTNNMLQEIECLINA